MNPTNGIGPSVLAPGPTERATERLGTDGSPVTDTERTIAAEARAVEEGHHTFIVVGGAIEVVSDAVPRLRYRLTYRGVNGYLVVSCTCPAGARGRSVVLGGLGCKHSALVARRLSREGLARWDGGAWRVGHKALAGAAFNQRTCSRACSTVRRSASKRVSQERRKVVA